jgi:hypothetical protein
MTPEERKKLIEDMTDAIEDVGEFDLTDMAAALAIAEPEIMRACAKIADTICPGAAVAILARIPEKNDD